LRKKLLSIGFCLSKFDLELQMTLTMVCKCNC
jgi:hypothetical protein